MSSSLKCPYPLKKKQTSELLFTDVLQNTSSFLDVQHTHSEF